jgi:hypothetical protein
MTHFFDVKLHHALRTWQRLVVEENKRLAGHLKNIAGLKVWKDKTALWILVNITQCIEDKTKDSSC